MPRQLLTIGQAAKRLGCDSWEVRRMYQRGLMPPAQRVGRQRVVPVKDLAALRKVLRETGYLK